MFFVLSKVLDLALSPLTWAIALFAFAIPWRARPPRSLRRRRLAGLAGALVLVVLSLEPVANALGWAMEHDAPSTYAPDKTYDVVVLLGGVTDERVYAATGAAAYNDDVERFLTTYDLLRRGQAKAAIVSGAAMSPELERFGEAVTMVAQLRAWGIAEDRLVVEPRARNTRENAVYAAELIRARGDREVLVVTSAFHMKRASECFEAVGLPFDTLAVDFRAHRGPSSWLPRAHHFATSSALVREWFGRGIYRLQGYAKPR